MADYTGVRNYSNAEPWNKAFADRLSAERKKKKLTQDQLAEILNVNPQVISNWERCRAIPDIRTMIELADIFRCDLDYLTGRIEEHTHDISQVCRITGLSEEAVKRIKGKVPTDALSHLIVSRGFVEFMTAYNSFLDLLSKMNHTDPEYGLWTTYRQRADGKVVMSNDDAVHHFMNKASMALNYICEEAYNQRIKEGKIRPHQRDYKELMAEIKATEQEIIYLQGEKEYLEKEILPTFIDSTNEGQ